MNSKNPFALFASILALAASPAMPARAADAPAAISGRVQNVVTGQFLNNARVTVRGTGLEVFTDQTGVYRLPQVPAGKVARSKVTEIATLKMKDLNANDIEAATEIIAGTARSMGIVVSD